MFQLIANLLSGSYAPHGYCFLWQPELVWTHAVSDLLIAAAYFSIPLALISFVRKRRDVQFGWMIWLFAVFILACGTTHVLMAWNLWHGDYGVEAVAKAITAIASVPTAILLWRLIPVALLLPSPGELKAANDSLAALVVERDAALAKLRQEVDQRRRAEEALVQAQKIEAVGQLTGGIAHDFNNLLQAVSGNLELIKARLTDTERVNRWLDGAMQGVERGMKLTAQLLAFSRTQKLQVRPLRPDALVAGMLDLIERSIGPRVTIETRLQAGDHAVLGDATQLELAILNLAINARDAMPDGGNLTLATQVVDIGEGDVDLAPGRYVELRVVDTGHGMSAEIAARALEPFFTTKGIGRGTGLGLSMAFGVARQAGGTLRLESSPGVGTTVHVLMPVVAAPVDQVPEADDKRLLPSEFGSGRTLLVVDDDDPVRAVTVEMLTGLGFRCVEAAAGDDALRRFDKGGVDGAVLDYAMPGMNGAELAWALQARRADLPILFVSGYSDTAQLERVAGPTRVLTKPFTARDLLGGLEELLVQQPSTSR